MKYKITLSLLFLLTVSTYAQVDTLQDPKSYFSAIIVSNMEESISWYQSKLGFEVLNKFESEEMGFKQSNLKRGNVLIELIESKTSIYPKEILKDKPKKTRIAGYFKFGFLVSDFDNWVNFLTKSNVDFHGNVVKDKLSEKRMVIIKDPDGNRIQLFEE